MSETNAYFEKMTKTPLVRLIVSLGIPTTISMLVTNIYNMVDTYFVGTLGPSQQAATGILFTLQCIIQAVAFMMGQGSGTLVSKALADKDSDEASTYVSSAFITGIMMGLVLMVLGVVFLEPLMRLLGSSDTILPYAKQYGICVIATCPIMIGSFVLNNNLRYEGQSFYAMIGLTIGGIINIFGDYLLINVMELGVLGAGLATAASQCISFGILFFMHKKQAQGKISFKYYSKSLNTYKAICIVGFPSLIRQGLSSFSNGLLNNITRPFGDAAIAAMSVVNRFTAFVMCVGLGVGQGYQPVASFNYQAKEYDRVKKGLLVTMGISFVFICLLAIPGIMFPSTVVSLFQKDPKVIEIGTFALRCSCVAVMFMPLSVPVNMLYQSIRKPKVASFLSILRNGLLFIPMLVVSTSLFGLVGIQISQPFADIGAGLISIPFILAFLTRKEFENY